MFFTENLSNITRLKAFLIHFSISSFIFFVLLYFILVQWYPQPLFSTDGGWQVIRIIAGVDLVLGPLLTLIVFKPGKAGLKFDLSMIALVQTLALCWGVWTTYNERPAAIIYTLDFFTPVPAYQLSEQGITSQELKKFGDDWPIMIYLEIPKEKISEVIVESMRANKPLYLLTQYYSKFSKQQTAVLKQNSMDIAKYVEDKPELKKLYLNSLLTTTNKNISYLALHSREKWVTAIFDLDLMKIVKTIDISPTAYIATKKVLRKKKK